MAEAGDVIRNPATGETLTFVTTGADSDGRLLRVDVVCEPGRPGPPVHVHRRFAETHEVREGRMRYRLDGAEHVVAAPGRFAIPRGAPHTFRVEGDAAARIVVDYEPAGTYEPFIETMYALASDGKTDERGAPRNILRTAVVAHEHLEDFALARPPYAVQRVLFAVLAPIGRLAGYGPSYPRRGG